MALWEIKAIGLLIPGLGGVGGFFLEMRYTWALGKIGSEQKNPQSVSIISAVSENSVYPFFQAVDKSQLPVCQEKRHGVICC